MQFTLEPPPLLGAQINMDIFKNRTKETNNIQLRHRPQSLRGIKIESKTKQKKLNENQYMKNPIVVNENN